MNERHGNGQASESFAPQNEAAASVESALDGSAQIGFDALTPPVDDAAEIATDELKAVLQEVLQNESEDSGEQSSEGSTSEPLESEFDKPSMDQTELPPEEAVAPAKSKSSSDPSGKKKKKRLPLLVRFLIKLVVLSGVLAAVFTFVLGVRIYHGNRMYPFIMDGDLLITYKLDDYHTGDVVAYRNPVTGETTISRIVAVGEKEIEVTELGALLVDGYSPTEQVFYPTKPLEGSEIVFPYRMRPDGYFLLDDYREIGMDSRLFGQVSREALLGKVVYVLRRRGI